jgi:hypothetical protein
MTIKNEQREYIIGVATSKTFACGVNIRAHACFQVIPLVLWHKKKERKWY